ncbi:hypothetical protein OE09_0989 [Flavobacteriaceae bacterium MAR_2010_72]|nr:hypothetical protein OE09_0989 [Flavobacteriaceae bacterium MAR_2010_72]TVZ60208.1 hypothetical protein NA63_2759 [Flavobacteriaceae bacterium MAR_2010_105]
MKNTLKILIITLITFGVYFILDETYFKTVRTWFFELTNQFGVSHIITYALSGIPILIGTVFISRGTSPFESLGLNKSLKTGLIVSIICTLPLLIGNSLVFDSNPKLSINTLLVTVIAAGFFEELFFRAFLFGQLFKHTRLGFIPSVFLGALFFGLIHLYQSDELTEIIIVFLVTFVGGILFAWVYAEWNYNLWVPIFIHMLMNLSWELFEVSDTAIGGMYSNIFRVISLGLVITVTLVYKRRKKMRLAITKSTIWLKKKSLLTN